MQEITKLREQVGSWESLHQRVSDATELLEMEEEELLGEIEQEVLGIATEVDKLEQQTLFSHKHDDKDVLFAIHAGAGGTEAQDWAAMLLRMFTRWCDAEGFKVDLLDESAGDVVGIKSCLLYTSPSPRDGATSRMPSSA